jgi:hypothetical protein
MPCNQQKMLLYLTFTRLRQCIRGFLASKISESEVTLLHCPFIDDHLTEAQKGWTCHSCEFFHTPAPKLGELVHCDKCSASQTLLSLTEPGCRCDITDPMIASILDTETFNRFQRLKSIQSNQSYRECPKCQYPNTVGPFRGSNALVCGRLAASRGCGYQYCFVHSDMHPGQSCNQYERSAREVSYSRRVSIMRAQSSLLFVYVQNKKRQEADALTEELIQRSTKPCPKCAQRTEKNGGCNHMKCTKSG